MPADWMPGAVHRPISYRAQAGRFARTPLGWILHVVVGNGSPYNLFQNAPPGARRFSHFWVSKKGTIEQYAETSLESWAQRDGNATYWSVETEGFPTEPLTDAQLTALAQIHTFLGAANVVASKPGDKGIGTHYMGGAAWGGHTCPDPSPGVGPRSRQRAQIIQLAGDEVTQSDIDAIAHAVWAYDQNGALRQAWSYIQDAADEATLAQIATAVVAARPPQSAGGVTTDQLKQAVKDALKEGVA